MKKEELINKHARSLKSSVGTGLALDECQEIIKHAVNEALSLFSVELQVKRINNIKAKISRIESEREELLDDYLKLDEQEQSGIAKIIVEKAFRIKDLEYAIGKNS